MQTSAGQGGGRTQEIIQRTSLDRLHSKVVIEATSEQAQFLQLCPISSKPTGQANGAEEQARLVENFRLLNLQLLSMLKQCGFLLGRTRRKKFLIKEERDYRSSAAHACYAYVASASGLQRNRQKKRNREKKNRMIVASLDAAEIFKESERSEERERETN